MEIFKNAAIIRWAKIKQFIDSAPEKSFIIRKIGKDYVIYPDGQSTKQIKL
mgnify:CR=1 FL=1